MRHCLAETWTDVDDLSIKATTTEQPGFEGREEGVSAYATVLVYKLWKEIAWLYLYFPDFIPLL